MCGGGCAHIGRVRGEGDWGVDTRAVRFDALLMTIAMLINFLVNLSELYWIVML